jgi:hypothetical protein
MDKYYSRRIRETSDDTIDEYSENSFGNCMDRIWRFSFGGFDLNDKELWFE